MPRLIISLKGYASIRIDYEEDQLAQGKFIEALKAVLGVGLITDPPEVKPETEKIRANTRIVFYECRACSDISYGIVLEELILSTQVKVTCRCGAENALSDLKQMFYNCTCGCRGKVYATKDVNEVKCKICKKFTRLY